MPTLTAMPASGALIERFKPLARALAWRYPGSS
jgi:hypothetical protein